MDINTERAEIASEAQVFVLDIPVDTTVDKMTELLNEPYDRGFYIHRALDWNGGARVIYVNRVKPAGQSPVSKEARALQFIQENMNMPAKEISAVLRFQDFPRSAAWVVKRQGEILNARYSK